MGEILGVGTTHYPPLISPDEDRSFPLTRTLRNNDKVPEDMKSPTNWPVAMRVEYGEDEGFKSAQKHRERLLKGFRQIRTAIDDFKPDIVLIWGDDQYENFKEDIIPPSACWPTTSSKPHPSTTATAATAATCGMRRRTRCSCTKVLPRRGARWPAD